MKACLSKRMIHAQADGNALHRFERGRRHHGPARGAGRSQLTGPVPPHYGFSLSNERTFLSWIRTALAVLAGGILLHELSGSLEPRWVVLALSGSLALLGGGIGVGAYWRWRGNEEAMRAGGPLPRPSLILSMSIAVLGLSLATAALVLLQ